jgi:hypothetical protein
MVLFGEPCSTRAAAKEIANEPVAEMSLIIAVSAAVTWR